MTPPSSSPWCVRDNEERQLTLLVAVLRGWSSCWTLAIAFGTLEVTGHDWSPFLGRFVVAINWICDQAKCWTSVSTRENYNPNKRWWVAKSVAEENWIQTPLWSSFHFWASCPMTGSEEPSVRQTDYDPSGTINSWRQSGDRRWNQASKKENFGCGNCC